MSVKKKKNKTEDTYLEIKRKDAGKKFIRLSSVFFQSKTVGLNIFVLIYGENFLITLYHGPDKRRHPFYKIVAHAANTARHRHFPF